VGLSPVGTAATSGLLYKPQMIDEGDCGAIGGIKISMGKRSTRKKPATAPLCPPQIPHDQTRPRTRAAAVGSQYICFYWNLNADRIISKHLTGVNMDHQLHLIFVDNLGELKQRLVGSFFFPLLCLDRKWIQGEVTSPGIERQHILLRL
jgi:hypothetical protein